jgi:uncharacterized protein RhaS with RHS repeats
MRAVIFPDRGAYSYAGAGYADPDAPTQIANGVSTSTFSYDQNGNLVQKTTDGTTTTYVYDYANRLTALGVLGATTTYAYDWAGNRVSQTGTSTTFLYPFKWYSVASSTGTGAKFGMINRAIAEAAKAFGVPAASIKKDNIRIALKAGRI